MPTYKVCSVQDAECVFKTEAGNCTLSNGCTQSKQTAGKLDLTTVPPIIIEEVAKVREFGIAKYKERDNWKKVDVSEYYKAIYRHWIAILKGEKRDKESGLLHLSHIACGIAFILELESEQQLTLTNAEGKACSV